MDVHAPNGIEPIEIVKSNVLQYLPMIDFDITLFAVRNYGTVFAIDSYIVKNKKIKRNYDATKRETKERNNRKHTMYDNGKHVIYNNGKHTMYNKQCSGHHQRKN